VEPGESGVLALVRSVKLWGPVAAGVVIALVVVLVRANAAALPGRVEVERGLAEVMADLQPGTTVTAACDEPAEGDFRCRLADDRGYRGWALVTAQRESGRDSRPIRPYQIRVPEARGYLLSARADLPVAPDGTVDKILTPEMALGPTVFAEVGAALQVAGIRGGGMFTCPDPGPGETVTCTATGAVPEATVERLDDGVRVRFRLPA
jgi:hypothetical protein